MNIFYKPHSIDHNNFVLLFFSQNFCYAIYYLLSPLFRVILRTEKLFFEVILCLMVWENTNFLSLTFIQHFHWLLFLKKKKKRSSVFPLELRSFLVPLKSFFELWCWKKLLRVPWTARRSNQSILKELSPEYSLEGLMLKLKLHWKIPWC